MRGNAERGFRKKIEGQHLYFLKFFTRQVRNRFVLFRDANNNTLEINVA